MGVLRRTKDDSPNPLMMLRQRAERNEPGEPGHQDGLQIYRWMEEAYRNTGMRYAPYESTRRI